MTIGIDARFYGPEGKGLGRYTQRLIENLEIVDQQNNYVIFLNDQNWTEYTPKNPRFRKAKANCSWYTLWEQIKMPWIIKKEGIDLMHYPHFNVALLTPCKFVVTIHDLILVRYPTRRASRLGPIKYFIKHSGYRLVIEAALRLSVKVITVSNYTKQDILKNFRRVSPGKIEITYEACDSVESGQMKLPDQDFKKSGVNKPYLLYVGNAYPHKNLESLLEVYAKLEKQKPGQFQLVLVGKEDYFYKRLKEHCQKLNLKIGESVIFWGFAPQSVLADLYRNARLYVFPSLLEGFGLPPLEAMRYHLPVTASNNSSCPEILGPAAIYFDPHDQKDMLAKILTGLQDETLRSKLVQKGLDQIKKYTWKECASQTLRIYQSV